MLGLLGTPSTTSAEIELAAGDVVAMVTDGATEAALPTSRELGETSGLMEALLRRGRQPPPQAQRRAPGRRGRLDAPSAAAPTT